MLTVQQEEASSHGDTSSSSDSDDDSSVQSVSSYTVQATKMTTKQRKKKEKDADRRMRARSKEVILEYLKEALLFFWTTPDFTSKKLEVIEEVAGVMVRQHEILYCAVSEITIEPDLFHDILISLGGPARGSATGFVQCLREYQSKLRVGLTPQGYPILGALADNAPKGKQEQRRGCTPSSSSPSLAGSSTMSYQPCRFPNNASGASASGGSLSGSPNTGSRKMQKRKQIGPNEQYQRLIFYEEVGTDTCHLDRNKIGNPHGLFYFLRFEQTHTAIIDAVTKLRGAGNVPYKRNESTAKDIFDKKTQPWLNYVLAAVKEHEMKDHIPPQQM